MALDWSYSYSLGLGDPCLMHSQVGVFSLQDHMHGQLGGCAERLPELGIGTVAAAPFLFLKLRMEMNMYHFEMII